MSSLFRTEVLSSVLLRTLLIYFSAALSVLAYKVNYDGQVHRVFPTSEQQITYLRKIKQAHKEFLFWAVPSFPDSPVDIYIPSTKITKAEKLLQNFNKEIYITNLQELINNVRPKRESTPSFKLDHYHTIEEIYSWLDALERSYPSIVTPVLVGSSYEERPIRGVRISYKAGNPGIFIESGTHAREWITIATSTFLLNELLTSNDTDVRYVAENFDWYIFPCVNPDGYVYSYTTDRIWRKTRSPNRGTNCTGADTNRNWDEHWDKGLGSSDDPCDEEYRGSHPFSEAETRSLSEYIRSIAEYIDIYISLHSFLQCLMHPYAHGLKNISNPSIHLAVAKAAAEEISKRNGTRYKIGSVIDILSPISGVSTDWAESNLNLKVNIIWELPDTGNYGFLQPESHIIPTGQETLDGFVAMMMEAEKYLSSAVRNSVNKMEFLCLIILTWKGGY